MYNQKLIDFANAEMVFVGGRSSLRRARAVYDNDQALFCEVLDALCLGKVGEFGAFADLCGSAAAFAVVVGTPAAWRLVANIPGAFASVLAADGAADAMLASDEAMATVGALDSATGSLLDEPWAAGRVAASGAAMSAMATSPYAMGRLCASQEAMGAMAASAVALNRVAKSDMARQKWMESAYADTYYDTIYSTLHGAPEELFEKHEEYYETSFKSPASMVNSPAPAWTKTDGSFELPKIGMKQDDDFSSAVPNESIVLCGSLTYDRSFTSGYVRYASSQTKKQMAIVGPSFTIKEYTKKVAAGGLCYYWRSDDATSFKPIAASAKFAVYTAI